VRTPHRRAQPWPAWDGCGAFAHALAAALKGTAAEC